MLNAGNIFVTFLQSGETGLVRTMASENKYGKNKDGTYRKKNKGKNLFVFFTLIFNSTTSKKQTELSCQNRWEIFIAFALNGI